MSGNGIALRVATLTFLATVAVSIPLVLGFLGGYHPAFDMPAQFRAHLAALLTLGGLALLPSRYWKQGLLAAILGAAALWTTLNAYPLGNPTAVARAEPGARATYRLLQLNLFHDNPTPERVLSLIGRVKPDVVTLEEVAGRWPSQLAKITAAYPYQFFCVSPGGGGTAIISRRPPRADTRQRCHGKGAVTVAAIEFGGPKIEVAAMHLSWPWPFEQPGQLAWLEPEFAKFGDTALLAGDFNATPWSNAMRRVEAAGGLSHIAGIGPTWLFRPFPDLLRRSLGLPIDQVLSKGHIEIVSVTTLDEVGSDHLPVLVEFAFRPGKPNEDQGTTTVMLSAPR